MKYQQYSVTDLFCGCGGVSYGAKLAGLDVAYAVDNWDKAVDSHRLNFPSTLSSLADITTMSTFDVGGTDILWASPSCTHHSRAYGKASAPYKLPEGYGRKKIKCTWQEGISLEPDPSKALMFQVPRFVKSHYYKVVIVENVPDIEKWPLFGYWMDTMDQLGYNGRVQRVDASLSDIGGPAVAQRRVRSIIIFHQGSVYDIRSWPKPHNPTLPASEILSFHPGEPLFDRKKPLAGRTLAKIALTTALNPKAKRMILPYYGNTNTGYDADLEPLHTLTTHDRFGVITAMRGKPYFRMLNETEMRRAMGLPDGYQLSGTKRDRVKQLGNAVCTNVARDAFIIARDLIDNG